MRSAKNAAQRKKSGTQRKRGFTKNDERTSDWGKKKIKVKGEKCKREFVEVPMS